MSEDYAVEYDGDVISFRELARAFREIDSIMPDYDMEKLRKACVQALKNRLWDNIQAVT